MGSSKPKPMQTPYASQQSQTNTYAPVSIAGTPEAQNYLNAPIDVDPGVGRRTDLAEQEAENRYNSAFNFGAPRFAREAGLAKELRDIRGQGAYEAQQANYMKNALELQRRERLLPQILQTGGSGSMSGYNTQIVQPQPGFWQRAALTAIGGAASLPRFGFGGGG